MHRIGALLTVILFNLSIILTAQDLQIIDRYDNTVVNDAEITIFSDDTTIIDLTKNFTMVNNTNRTLNLYLRKVVHTIADSTVDYFCFGIKCWPETDTTDYPATIEAGEEDYSFASHVVHYRRFELPPLPPGLTSITYIIYDYSLPSDPIEAKVTVNYHLKPVSIKENNEITVSAFPNPTSNKLTIQTNELISDNIELTIYDLKGSMVMKRNVNIMEGYLEIGVDELDSGLYVVQLFNNSKRFAPIKIVIQK